MVPALALPWSWGTQGSMQSLKGFPHSCTLGFCRTLQGESLGGWQWSVGFAQSLFCAAPAAPAAPASVLTDAAGICRAAGITEHNVSNIRETMKCIWKISSTQQVTAAPKTVSPECLGEKFSDNSWRSLHSYKALGKADPSFITATKSFPVLSCKTFAGFILWVIIVNISLQFREERSSVALQNNCKAP